MNTEKSSNEEKGNEVLVDVSKRTDQDVKCNHTYIEKWVVFRGHVPVCTQCGKIFGVSK